MIYQHSQWYTAEIERDFVLGEASLKEYVIRQLAANIVNNMVLDDLQKMFKVEQIRYDDDPESYRNDEKRIHLFLQASFSETVYTNVSIEV